MIVIILGMAACPYPVNLNFCNQIGIRGCPGNAMRGRSHRTADEIGYPEVLENLSHEEGHGNLLIIKSDYNRVNADYTLDLGRPLIIPPGPRRIDGEARAIAYGNFCQCIPSKRRIWGVFVGRTPHKHPPSIPLGGRNA